MSTPTLLPFPLLRLILPLLQTPTWRLLHPWKSQLSSLGKKRSKEKWKREEETLYWRDKDRLLGWVARKWLKSPNRKWSCQDGQCWEWKKENLMLQNSHLWTKLDNKSVTSAKSNSLCIHQRKSKSRDVGSEKPKKQPRLSNDYCFSMGLSWHI